jgi:hypothetical protein
MSPLKRTPKPVAPSDAPEPPKAQRILPALARPPGQDLTETPSIDRSPSERKTDIEEVSEASVESNALATETGGMVRDAPKARLRHGDSEMLPAGQRWKRRLPRILR